MVAVNGPAVRGMVLGCPVDVVTMDTAVERMVALVENRRGSKGAAARSRHEPAIVVTLNPEMVMRAQREADFRAILDRAALIIPDGVGVVTALHRRGHPDAVRVAGTDLLEAYLPHAARLGHRLGLAGGAPDVTAEAARRLRWCVPGLQVVAADSGDPDGATAGRLRRASPDVVCAAYGAGRQERFLNAHLAAIGAGVGIGIGGALDFVAGRSRRAPEMVREAGFEWAWRLFWEPRRLRRQSVLPAFWWRERREAIRER
ncbi:MAG: WecB/TagA/CpsF family glycosyltransferase [Candidatus Dormibacteria bacterium]